MSSSQTFRMGAIGDPGIREGHAGIDLQACTNGEPIDNDCVTVVRAVDVSSN